MIQEHIFEAKAIKSLDLSDNGMIPNPPLISLSLSGELWVRWREMERDGEGTDRGGVCGLGGANQQVINHAPFRSHNREGDINYSQCVPRWTIPCSLAQ